MGVVRIGGRVVRFGVVRFLVIQLIVVCDVHECERGVDRVGVGGVIRWNRPNAIAIAERSGVACAKPGRCLDAEPVARRRPDAGRVHGRGGDTCTGPGLADQQLAQAPTPIDHLSPSAAQAASCDFPARPELSGLITNARTATPAAEYQEGVTPQDLKSALDKQDCYAREQWAAGQGVVGPVGQEQQGLFAGYNDTTDPDFATYQQFAYQHDMQAADAQLQQGLPDATYDQALAGSATVGMLRIELGGTVDQALAAARDSWLQGGFDVRTRY